MSYGFCFNGRRASEFGLVVEKLPAINAPARKRSAVSIPGRNGDLHYDENAFHNYNQPYECWFRGTVPTPEQAHIISSWLLSTAAGSRLEDGYDPKYYRMATFSGPMDIENILNRFGRCTITFECAPQSFLKSGDIPMTFSAAAVVYNPTAFPAQPRITIHGSGAGTLTVGERIVEIRSIPDGSLVLDCETMDAYWEGNNRNSCIYAPEFPELVPGNNAISWTGGINSIEIIPRWWTI